MVAMNAKPKKIRLDDLLVERGDFPDRATALRAVMAREVRVDDVYATSAAIKVAPTADIFIRGRKQFVSRGGKKLQGALDAFKQDVAGMNCLDIGSSTGGFTDCLLQAGASRVALSDESVTRSLYRQFFLDHGAVLKPDTEAATTDQMLTLVKSELGLAFVPEPMARDSLERGELVQLHLQEIIPTRSICLVYDRHRPLNTAARKFQQMLTKADPPRPAESKQTESISFVSQ